MPQIANATCVYVLTRPQAVATEPFVYDFGTRHPPLASHKSFSSSIIVAVIYGNFGVILHPDAGPRGHLP